MPIGDKYLPPEHREESSETVPLDLLLCDSCGHLQNNSVIDPLRIYPHYLSRPAAVNPVLSDAYREYAEGVLAKYSPAKGSLVVEMGSNDGIFLNFFRNQGMSVLGVDPALNLAETATNAGVETLPELFTSEIARKIRQEWNQASVVIANFMYANLDNLDDVTDGIRGLLAPDGVFMFETNYRADVFQKDLIETINHEHLSYFSIRPLQVFFRKHGMKMVDAQRVPSKGGSIRCAVRLADNQHEISPSVEKMIEDEMNLKLYDVDFYQSCASHIAKVRGEIDQMASGIRSAEKKMAAYGTSIGATTLIYQLGLGESLEFLVDDDPYRQNLVSPGYHIPVVSAEALATQRPEHVAVLAPLYSEIIRNKNSAYTQRGGHFIDVWPSVVHY